MSTDYMDPATGELLDDIEDAEQVDLTTIALRRHEAKEQEEAWKQRRIICDAMLLKRQEEKVAVYGERVKVRIAGGSYSKFNRDGFRASIEGQELIKDELMALVLAAKDFDADAIPAEYALCKGYVRDNTAKLQKHPWIESGVVLKVAMS